MTWLDMANLLFEQSKPLSPNGAHLHLDTAGWLRTWTPHQTQAADAAVRWFAHHKEWPPMEPEAAWQIYFRCLFAIERCFEYHAQRTKGGLTLRNEEAALESLLVDCWQLEGLGWAEHRYTPRAPRTVRVPRAQSRLSPLAK